MKSKIIYIVACFLGAFASVYFIAEREKQIEDKIRDNYEASIDSLEKEKAVEIMQIRQEKEIEEKRLILVRKEKNKIIDSLLNLPANETIKIRYIVNNYPADTLDAVLNGIFAKHKDLSLPK